MTKAKIGAAAKAVHPVVVQVADAALAHAAILQPRGAFTKPAHPRLAARRAMKRAKRPSAHAVQRKHAHQAKAQAKSVPLSQEPSAARAIVRFQPARHAKARARANVRLRQGRIVQRGIVQRAIGPFRPVHRVTAPRGIVEGHPVLKARYGLHPSLKKIRASVSPR
jgi:hypothetical protein